MDSNAPIIITTIIITITTIIIIIITVIIILFTMNMDPTPLRDNDINTLTIIVMV